MNKRPLKLLSVWVAISAVVIIAGIVLMALLGFNTAASHPESYIFEVRYNIVVEVSDEASDKLAEICEDSLAAKGVKVLEEHKTEGRSDNQDWFTLTYTLPADVEEETLAAVKTAITTAVSADSELSGDYAQVYVGYKPAELISDADWMWRGAIAVGAVAALIYVGVRFGVGSALTGLTLAVHDALCVLAVLAIARIPVYAAAPMLYAAMAAVLSVLFWLVYCIRLRDHAKATGGSVDAGEAVVECYNGVAKLVLILAGVIAASLVVCGIVGLVLAPAMSALVLPMLLSVVAPVYSSLLLGPALHVHVKRAFDKLSKKNKTKYVGKQKSEE